MSRGAGGAGLGRRGARGVTLPEALVACVVMGTGLLGMAAAHGRLHAQGELARQQVQAAQLAQAGLEQLRAAAAAGAPAPAASATAGPFTLQRQRTEAGPGLLALRVGVDWRSGLQAQSMALNGFATRFDAALSGALALPAPGAGPGAGAYGRHAAIPLGAQRLGDGRSAWRPDPRGTRVWVFQDRSGAATQRCRAAAGAAPLRAQDLAECEALSGAAVVAGTLRFAPGADGPPVARALTVTLQRSDAGAASGAECLDDAPTADAPGRAHVHYACLLADAARGWSGRLRLQLQGLAWGTAPGQARLCRYAAADADRGAAETPHPAEWRDVRQPLPPQNFLVVPGERPCPGAEAGAEATVQAQPAA